MIGLVPPSSLVTKRLSGGELMGRPPALEATNKGSAQEARSKAPGGAGNPSTIYHTSGSFGQVIITS